MYMSIMYKKYINHCFLFRLIQRTIKNNNNSREVSMELYMIYYTVHMFSLSLRLDHEIIENLDKKDLITVRKTASGESR